MKIYYKNKLLFENISEKEIDSKINEYIEKEKTKYKDLYEKIENMTLTPLLLEIVVKIPTKKDFKVIYSS